MAPAQFFHYATDVVAVIRHTKLTVNHFCYPLGGPQIRVVSKGQRALEQDLFELSPLFGCQPRRAARGQLHREDPIPLLGPQISPSHNRARCTLDLASHSIQGEALVEKLKGPATTISDQIRRSRRSHNEYPPWVPIIALLTQRSIIIS